MGWEYFNRYEMVTARYLPNIGEGNNKATQLVTAVCKLVYKWFNDGDVYDNTHAMQGWCNDLSSYANWLYKHTDAQGILEGICNCYIGSDYEKLLMKLADKLLDDEDLENLAKQPKVDSIYDCDGPFEFAEYDDDDY